jgi:hypothetical protein
MKKVSIYFLFYFPDVGYSSKFIVLQGLLTAVEEAFDSISLDSSSDGDPTLYISSDDTSSTVSSLTDNEYDENDLEDIDIPLQDLGNDQQLIQRQLEVLEAVEVNSKCSLNNSVATDSDDNQILQVTETPPVAEQEHAEPVHEEADATILPTEFAGDVPTEEAVENEATIINNEDDGASVSTTDEEEIQNEEEKDEPVIPVVDAVAEAEPVQAPATSATPVAAGGPVQQTPAAAPLHVPRVQPAIFYRPAPFIPPLQRMQQQMPVFLGPRKKDGTPDFRYKLNRMHLYYNGLHHNIDGSLDMRYYRH